MSMYNETEWTSHNILFQYCSRHLEETTQTTEKIVPTHRTGDQRRNIERVLEHKFYVCPKIQFPKLRRLATA